MAADGKSYCENHGLQIKNQSEKKKREREEGKVTASGEFAGGGGERRDEKRRKKKESESDRSDENSTLVKDLPKRHSIPKKDKVNRIVDNGASNSEDTESNSGDGKVESGVGQRSSTKEQSKSGSRLPVSCSFFFPFPPLLILFIRKLV